MPNQPNNPYGQPYNQPYGQQPYNQQYNQQYNQPYGQQPMPTYGQPYAPGAPQVIFVTPPQPPVPEEKPSNGVGKAGFIISIISACLGWLPYGGWALWFVGFLLSFIGVFRRPRGLAVAGLIISGVDLIIIISVAGIILTALASAFD